MSRLLDNFKRLKKISKDVSYNKYSYACADKSQFWRYSHTGANKNAVFVVYLYYKIIV